MASKFLPLRRRLLRIIIPKSQLASPSYYRLSSCVLESSTYLGLCSVASTGFCSRPRNLDGGNQGPAPIDYGTLLQETEFHRLADNTIHRLQEKFEEYGDNVRVDGFDIDYGSEVLTLKLGEMGTYVLNKQTPNRQIWLSSPLSGPARFDWDSSAQAWVYRRTKANLLQVLESEVKQLCGEPINLS